MISPNPVKATKGFVVICYREQLMWSLTLQQAVAALSMLRLKCFP